MKVIRTRTAAAPLDGRQLILRSLAQLGSIPYFINNGWAVLPPGHREVTDWVSSAIVSEYLQRGWAELRGGSLYITTAGRAEAGVPEPDALTLDELTEEDA